MKVCIDPGHGMSNRSPGVCDPGCTHTEGSFQFREADIVLKYGLSLKDVLRARQIDVFMTRDDNSDHAPVGSRAANAKRSGCDVYVSLHMNDVEDDAANGLEVLYRDNQDKPLAQRAQDALIKATKLRDRKIKQRTDLAVLKFDGPAILIELGFIANDKDREILLNPQMRETISETIADVLQSSARSARRAPRK
jgi:N-acetylmuramoyl-L-alanine amidase